MQKRIGMWLIYYTTAEKNSFIHYSFLTQVLEKLAKALWVKNNEESIPPRIHNIVLLLEQQKLHSDASKKFFIKMNDFQLEGLILIL